MGSIPAIGVTDLGQLLSSEVEGDGLCVAGVVDFYVDLVVVLVFPDERSLEAGHLVLLPVDQDLRLDTQVVNSHFSPFFFLPSPRPRLYPTTCGGLRALMNSLVCW